MCRFLGVHAKVGAPAELLATLSWVLSCKTASFTRSAQWVTVGNRATGRGGCRWKTDRHTRLCKTPPPLKIPSALGLSGGIASNSTGWLGWLGWLGWPGSGGGWFTGGKGHRSAAVRSVCGLNVSDSRLRAARGLCSLGRSRWLQHILRLEGEGEFQSDWKRSSLRMKGNHFLPNSATFQRVLINNPEGTRIFTSARASPRGLRMFKQESFLRPADLK